MQCGVYDQSQVLAQIIQNLVKLYSIASQNLLRHRSSHMFFLGGIPDLPVHNGPCGDKNLSLTSMRSLAVDPKFVPPGATLWLEVGRSGVKIKDRCGMLVMLQIRRAVATLWDQGR